MKKTKLLNVKAFGKFLMFLNRHNYALNFEMKITMMTNPVFSDYIVNDYVARFLN